MHLLLTDRLCCPRCGPSFGLILRADRLEDRRVDEGALGCPNCRDAFPISAGHADLRPPPRRALGGGLAGRPGGAAPEGRSASELRAMLGLATGPGTVALLGSSARLTAELSAEVDGTHVVGIDPDLRHWPEAEGVSRIVVGPRLPFFDMTLRGIVMDAKAWTEADREAAAGQAVREALRVLVPKGRFVLLRPTSGVDRVLEEAGLDTLARESEVLVAERR